MSDAPLLTALSACLGRGGVVAPEDGGERYLVDERRLYRGRALAILRPDSTQALADVVRLCRGAGIALVPQGGNTGYCGGATPDDSGRQVVVSMERMRRVLAVDPTGFTLTAQAGVTLREVQEAAAAAGRLFPLSMGSEGSAQLGGVLSTNAGGLAVLRYGTARELVLGLEVVLPDGRIWNGLRALRKDNTGYDLKHWFLGAEGTLGIITAAVLKLFPLPAARETAWVAVDTLADAVALLAALREALGDTVTSFEYLAPESLQLVLAHETDARAPLPASGAAVLVEVCGMEAGALRASVEAALAAALATGLARDCVLAGSETQRRALWRLRERIPAAEKALGGSVKHDISVALGALPELEAQGRAWLAKAHPGAQVSVYGHVGDGNLHFNVLAPAGVDTAAFLSEASASISDALHGFASALGGSFSAEHGVGKLKKALLAASEGEVAMDLMRGLKRALDPAGLMNPGKLFD